MFTLFYQEAFSSQLSLARYMGDNGYITSTGEKVICNSSPKLIINPFVGDEIKMEFF